MIESKKQSMIRNQILSRGEIGENVLYAMEKVPREAFVPEGLKEQAYEDFPLQIGEGQTISQPFIVAYMTDSLKINKDDKILEVGTGSGYQTAVLAELAKHVYTIERIQTLSTNAQQTLLNLGYKNISFRIGDGYMGWPEAAPFDKIILTAAPIDLPSVLLDQLALDGILLAPVGSAENQELIQVARTKAGFSKKSLFPVRFVPMIKS